MTAEYKIPEINAEQARKWLATPPNGPMFSTLVNIGPELARDFLQTNTVNRNLRAMLVNHFRDIIESGQWMCTHQGIAVRTTGELHDGQHRLSAIARTAHTVPVMVTWNANPASMGVIDTGARRTPGDAFTLHGVAPGAATATAAAVRMLLRYRSGNWTDKSTVTNTALIEGFEAEPEINDVHLASQRMARFSGLPRTACQVAIHLMYRSGHTDAAAVFVDQLTTGEGLVSGMPALSLIRQVRNKRDSKQKLPQRTALGLIGRAWCAHVQGQQPKYLRFTENDAIADMENPDA